MLKETYNPVSRADLLASIDGKVQALPALTETVAGWRAEGAKTIGITSGVFDIFHPGHASFLLEAAKRCDRLIVIVASDRTIRELKGDKKPRVSERDRASVIALMPVDAVIISDEFDHASILAPLHPEVMFKGYDYAGKDVWGKEHVGRVEIIECSAANSFYSSTHFLRLIRDEEQEPIAPSPFG